MERPELQRSPWLPTAGGEAGEAEPDEETSPAAGADGRSRLDPWERELGELCGSDVEILPKNFKRTFNY